MWFVFPNQIFPEEIVKTIPNWKEQEYVLWEDPLFYGIRPDGKLSLNKLRIIYQKWLWLNYEDELRRLGLRVRVVPMEQATPERARELIGTGAGCFDPEDQVLQKRWKKLPMTWHDSPMFLLPGEAIERYKTGKRLQHSHFYRFVQKEVFPGIAFPPSQDKENRKPVGPGVKIPGMPWGEKKELPRNLMRAVEWCEEHFEKNNGPAPENIKRILETYLVYLPSNGKEAWVWWRGFCKSRFPGFGPYEDAIVAGEPVLFHSFCAMLLNFGLLTPKKIIEDLMAHMPITSGSAEGFIRQVAGWREYSRLYYRVVPKRIWSVNIFKNNGRLNKAWYNEDGTGPEIVQEAIRDAWNMGYLHHIRRLMVVSNYMNLMGIHPKEVYRWMFEFSLDSWEWVMVFNVYSMGTWSDGGHAMRKPYVSSPAYLLRMAGKSYEKGGWVEEWKGLYERFLWKHRGILRHTVYASQLRA